MKALCIEGQTIIDNYQIKNYLNRRNSVVFIKESLDAIKCDNLPRARERVCQAYKLIFDACRASLIVVQGQIPMVANELSDIENHSRLSLIKNTLFSIYADFSQLDDAVPNEGNVINYRTFQLCRIIKGLAQVIQSLIDYEKRGNG